jgi:hypothetical protein
MANCNCCSSPSSQSARSCSQADNDAPCMAPPAHMLATTRLPRHQAKYVSVDKLFERRWFFSLGYTNTHCSILCRCSIWVASSLVSLLVEMHIYQSSSDHRPKYNEVCPFEILLYNPGSWSLVLTTIHSTLATRVLQSKLRQKKRHI